MKAAFTHVPRPPIVPESHPTQRYFCPPENQRGLGGVGGLAVNGFGKVEFYRAAGENNARLSVSLRGGSGYAGAWLTADELREVARLCLDCAHDIETVPGAGV